MRIIYTLLFLCFAKIVSAQHQPLFDLNFRDTTVINQVFYTDSIIDSLGVWQIDSTNKTFFDSAYGLVTYADTALLPNTKASFIITLPGVPIYEYQGMALILTHKYDFDSAKSGAYIEFSVDTGLHWHGVMSPLHNFNLSDASCVSEPGDFFQVIDGQYTCPPIYWNNPPTDTLNTGIYYFTGTDSKWLTDTIIMPTLLPFKTNQLTHFMFKFTVFADSATQPTAGWMIRDIKYYQPFMNCVSGINEVNSSHLKVYPNPTTEAFEISLLNETPGDYEATLYDLAGRALIHQPFTGQETSIHRAGLESGTYLIKVTNSRNQNTFEKTIVFE